MSAVLFKLNVGKSGLKETIVSRKEVVEVDGVERVRIRTDYTAITLPKAKHVEVNVVEVEPVKVMEETVEYQEQPHVHVEIPVFEAQQDEEYIYEEYIYEEYIYENIDADFNDIDDSDGSTYRPFDMPRSARVNAAKRNPNLGHKVCMGLNLSPIAIEEAMEYAQTDMIKDIKKDVKKAIWNLIK